jgi:hypothetical protein
MVTLRGAVAGFDVPYWRCTIDIASGRAYVTSAQGSESCSVGTLD